MQRNTIQRKYFRTPFCAEYWRQAFSELKNTRTLVFAALILALRIAMKPLRIPVAADVNITFGFIVNALGSMVYGPVVALISGAVYAIVKFSDKNVALLNNALVNGADFKTYNDGKFAAAMFFLISIPPAIGMLLAAIPTWKYALTDKEHTRILDELNAKRNAAETTAE